MRRMYGGYFKGFRNASALRMLIMEESTKEGVLEVLLNFAENEHELKISAYKMPKPIKGVKKVQLPPPKVVA